jgi:trk system potassium uptake protein
LVFPAIGNTFCQIPRKASLVKYLGFLARQREWLEVESGETNLGIFEKTRKAFEKLSFARVVVLGFVCAIFLGSFALYVSEWNSGKLSYINALYLSGSALCVTGLSPLPISTLSYSSQCIIMTLIQMGGLGIISVTVIIGYLVQFGLSRNTGFVAFTSAAIDRDSEKEAIDQTKIIRMLKAILNISVTMEALGAVGLYLHMPNPLPVSADRLFLSIFTAVSAFNNAGFSIVDDLAFLKDDSVSLLIISLLVILGGIGFPVIILLEKILLTLINKLAIRMEILSETIMLRLILQNKVTGRLQYWLEKPTELSFRLMARIEDYNEHLHGESGRSQTKLILYGTLILLLAGFFGIFWQEAYHSSSFKSMSFTSKLTNAFFVSVCARTAGFGVVDLTQFTDSSIVIITMLMFIGGGPQGTAGGIKITTFGLLLGYLKNVIQPANPVKIFGETVSKNSVAIAIRVYFLASILLASLFLVLVVLDNNQHSMENIFFELVSAFFYGWVFPKPNASIGRT